ncbi:MAG: 4Fe-4S binding protein [Patescibacteria group bacterium]|nr:4Fe-4S binding protein [Patescibacteria group bacterium]
MSIEKLKSSNELKRGAVLKQKQDSSLKYKTGSWRTFKPDFDEAKCIHCLQCVYFCPENCILIKQGKRDKVDLDYCKGCGLCAQICPVQAIKMIKDNKNSHVQKNTK